MYTFASARVHAGGTHQKQDTETTNPWHHFKNPLTLGLLSQAEQKGQKVKATVSALQAAMRSRGPDLYIKPLVTSHASQGEMEEALTLIERAKEAQLEREASNGHASTSGALLSLC